MCESSAPPLDFGIYIILPDFSNAQTATAENIYLEEPLVNAVFVKPMIARQVYEEVTIIVWEFANHAFKIRLVNTPFCLLVRG